MTYEEIVSRVAKENNLDEVIVDRVYKGYWLAIKSIIATLPLKANLSEEEFSKYRTNFNIPALGKLHCTYDRMKAINNRFKLINQLKNDKT